MSCEKTASKAPQAKDANFPCRPLSPPPVPPKEWVVTKPSSKRLVVNIDGADDRVFISPRMQPQSLSPKRFPQIPPISEHTQLHFQHQDPDQSQQGSSPSQDVIKTVPTLPTTTAAATATATGAALLSVEQSTRTTKSFDGYRVKVIIPELSGTKMAIAQPTQTTDDFIKTILKYPYDSLVSDDLRLLIPMVPSPHNVRGFIMRPDTFMGTYGIGIPSKSSNSDNACNEIPVLILVNKSEEGVYDLSQHEEFLTSQSAGLQTELIPAPWCEVLTDMNAFTTSKRKKLRKLIMEGGIPAPIRGHVWAELAEATDLVRKNSGVFESIAKVAEEKSPPYTRKIRVDLCRSMPIHVFFSSPDSPGIKPLSRVLFAFGEYEHDIGYCQGLNFIAALLLSVMNEEVHSSTLSYFYLCFNFGVSAIYFLVCFLDTCTAHAQRPNEKFFHNECSFTHILACCLQ